MQRAFQLQKIKESNYATITFSSEYTQRTFITAQQKDCSQQIKFKIQFMAEKTCISFAFVCTAQDVRNMHHK